MASALHYIGYKTAAKALILYAPKYASLPSPLAMKKLPELMESVAKEIARPTKFNGYKPNGKRRQWRMTPEELVSTTSEYITFVYPIGMDGSADHVVCVVNNLVFDPKYKFALKLSMEALNFVCGKQGMHSLGEVMRFNMPQGVKKNKQYRDKHKRSSGQLTQEE